MPLILHASTDRHYMWGGPRQYIRILIHDTTKELQKAASRFRPYEDWSSAGGVFHSPDIRETYFEETDEWKTTSDPHYAGMIRFSRDYLNTEVVAHEAAHAAIFIYRRDLDENVTLGDEVGEKEENLCYIIGDVTASVNTALHVGGVFNA